VTTDRGGKRYANGNNIIYFEADFFVSRRDCDTTVQPIGEESSDNLREKITVS
jgi:hypothetical protein